MLLACPIQERLWRTASFAEEHEQRKKGSTSSSFRVTDVVWWSLLWKQEVAGAQHQFVEKLAAARARDAPDSLQQSSFLSGRRRWSRMLATSRARSCACFLLAPTTLPHALEGIDGFLVRCELPCPPIRPHDFLESLQQNSKETQNKLADGSNLSNSFLLPSFSHHILLLHVTARPR